jgi:hypothetical protein
MSWAFGVPALEQVPAGHATVVQTPPEQLPAPLIRPSCAAEAATELKNTNDNAIAKIFMPVSLPRRLTASAHATIAHDVRDRELPARP